MDLPTLLRTRGTRQAELAAVLGVSPPHMSQLISGASRWTLRNALKVEKWSGGEVRAVDLLAPADADLLQFAIARSAATADA